MPAATPPLVRAAPPPLMVPTTVAALAAAATGCDASIAPASETAGTRLRSFLIMSLFPPVITSESQRCAPTRRSPPASLDQAVRPPDGRTYGGFAACYRGVRRGAAMVPHSSPAPVREQAACRGSPASTAVTRPPS